jgi:hypothetical protein
MIHAHLLPTLSHAVFILCFKPTSTRNCMSLQNGWPFRLFSSKVEANAGTYSPISLSLPSTNAESGSYGESLNRNSGSFYNNKETKTICLAYNNEMLGKGFEMSATAYGNMFYPDGGRRNMMALGSTETPQGIRLASCGNQDN